MAFFYCFYVWQKRYLVMPLPNDQSQGLVLLFTGNGKGKTTAALGMAFRALGHGQRVCVIQFIKGSWKYGELVSARQFAGQLDVHVMGRGFTWQSDDLDKDRAAAREAWEFAVQTVESGAYKLVILDELTYLPYYQILDEAEIIDLLRRRPSSLNLVITGRHASPALIEASDLVTEMREIKHPYANGTKARKGIEF